MYWAAKRNEISSTIVLAETGERKTTPARPQKNGATGVNAIYGV